MEIFAITTTTDSEQNAVEIAKALVDERLVACAQVEGPIRSFYRWQGNLEDSQEWRVLAKTKSEAVEQAVFRIKELHQYDVPAILVDSKQSVNEDYSKWFIESVSD